MAAGRFDLQAIREFAVKAMMRLRGLDAAEYREYPPFVPADSGLAILPPLAIPGEASRDLVGWASLGGSVFIHGCILAFALTYPLLPSPGASQKASAPISVEVVDTKVFEALEPGQQQQATGSSAQAAADAMADPKTTAAIAESHEPPPSQQPATETQAAPEQVLGGRDQTSIAGESFTGRDQASIAGESFTGRDQASIAAQVQQPAAEVSALPAAKPEEKAEPAPAEQPASVQPSRNSKAKRERQEHHRHALVASRATAGENGSEASAAQVSASRGALVSYRDRVQAHLAANKPSGGAGSGTVKVAFSLSTSGQLMSARVLRSSGNRALDQMALNAVRGASPYPSPPVGMSRSQLLFNFPFYFQ